MCRTFIGYDVNGMGQNKDGRGNACPVTIIMPTLAMQAKEKTIAQFGEENSSEAFKMAHISNFMKLLDKKIGEAKDMLLERFEWLCKQSPKSAPFMYGNHTAACYDEKEGVRSALKHFSLAIGQIALAETLQILVHADHSESDEAMNLAKEIEGLFKKRCAEYKKEYKLNFGVYLTPAESLCKTSLEKFKAKYGVIENVSDKKFFTNSIHVPVWKEMTPFEKIDIESQLTSYSNAGCITYVELPSTTKNNLEALETIVNYAMDKDIPYLAINIPVDNCNSCGYSDEMGDICPKCGSDDIIRLRRVTGYLSQDYRNFNEGKIDEVSRRVKHIKKFEGDC